MTPYNALIAPSLGQCYLVAPQMVGDGTRRRKASRCFRMACGTQVLAIIACLVLVIAKPSWWRRIVPKAADQSLHPAAIPRRKFERLFGRTCGGEGRLGILSGDQLQWWFSTEKTGENGASSVPTLEIVLMTGICVHIWQ